MHLQGHWTQSNLIGSVHRRFYNIPSLNDSPHRLRQGIHGYGDRLAHLGYYPV